MYSVLKNDFLLLYVDFYCECDVLNVFEWTLDKVYEKENIRSISSIIYAGRFVFVNAL